MPLPTLSVDYAKDFALDLSGDLVLDSTGDIACVVGMQVLQQEIAVRIRTLKGDYFYQPQCGTLLETLVGQPNSPFVRALGESMIQDALTHDGLLTENSLSVISVEQDASTILFVVLVDPSVYGYEETNALSLEFTFDLHEGSLL